jgi:hypothetical protein
LVDVEGRQHVCLGMSKQGTESMCEIMKAKIAFLVGMREL